MTNLTFQRTPWRHDPRSKKFSNHRFFGTVAPANLPETLGRPRRHVENQKSTLRCTGYGTAVNGGYIHGMRFHPDWQAAKIGQLQGQSVDDNGGDPNATMRSQRDFGYLPFTLAAVQSIESNTVENTGWKSYDPALDKHAYENRVAGFVSVDGPYDLFDDIRSALFQAYDPATQRGACVQAFGKWYTEWTNTEGGIIPSSYGSLSFGAIGTARPTFWQKIKGFFKNLFGVFTGYHHYLFIDFCTINGVQYLIAQNSYADTIGAGGFHYFPREVVNREFGVWGSSLKIVKPLKKEWIEEAKKETPEGRIWRAILGAWYAISELWIKRGT